VILKFSRVISLVCYKDMDIQLLVPASVSHHCLVLSCLVMSKTCCNKVNVVLAEGERVRSGSRIQTPGTLCMGTVAPDN